MLHVNWHHFLLSTKLLHRDTDAKYRPVFQGEKMFAIIFFWMALFVSVANLETAGKKENNEPHSKLYNGRVKIIFKILQTHQTFVALQRKNK